MSNFKKELTQLINRHSKEVESNTADYILAEYICQCLDTFSNALIERDCWNGNEKE